MRARQVSRENHIQPTNAALDKPQAGVLVGVQFGFEDACDKLSVAFGMDEK